MTTAIFSRIPVASSSRPGLRHVVTVRRDTMTATACDCEAGRLCKMCRHKRTVQLRLDAVKAAESKWLGKVTQREDRTCRECGGPSVGMLFLRRAEDGGRPLGYFSPQFCPKCGLDPNWGAI